MGISNLSDRYYLLIDAGHKESPLKNRANMLSATSRPMNRKGAKDAKIFLISCQVPDVSKKPLQAAIQGQVSLDSIIHSDGWRGYDRLVDMGYKKR